MAARCASVGRVVEHGDVLLLEAATRGFGLLLMGDLTINRCAESCSFGPVTCFWLPRSAWLSRRSQAPLRSSSETKRGAAQGRVVERISARPADGLCGRTMKTTAAYGRHSRRPVSRAVSRVTLRMRRPRSLCATFAKAIARQSPLQMIVRQIDAPVDDELHRRTPAAYRWRPRGVVASVMANSAGPVSSL